MCCEKVNTLAFIETNFPKRYYNCIYRPVSSGGCVRKTWTKSMRGNFASSKSKSIHSLSLTAYTNPTELFPECVYYM